MRSVIPYRKLLIQRTTEQLRQETKAIASMKVWKEIKRQRDIYNQNEQRTGS